MHLEEAAFVAFAKWPPTYGLVTAIFIDPLFLGAFVTSFHVHMTKS
jgi:hypothetical protein